jgi:uncharacterized protein YqiB (DUF1249 family)
VTGKVSGLDPQRSRRLYEKLLKLAPEIDSVREHAKSKVPGFMDLNLDVLERGNGYLRIALSHYWQHPSGDLIADPDMEIGLHLEDRLAEALNQDTFIYEVSYPRDGEVPELEAHTRLNEFLEHWLDNLFEQGHRFSTGMVA